MSSLVLVLRVCFGPLPVSFISLFGLVWQTSLIICMGILNCCSLIYISVVHQLTWVHEWSSSRIHVLCSGVVLFHLMAVVGTDLIRVSFLRVLEADLSFLHSKIFVVQQHLTPLISIHVGFFFHFDNLFQNN